MPRPYSTWLLLLLLLAMLLLAARSAQDKLWQPFKLLLRGIKALVVPPLRLVRAILRRNRQQLAYPTALTACVLMGISAYNFRPENGGLPVDDAARQMAAGGLLLGVALWLAKDDAVVRAQRATPLHISGTKTRWLSLVIGLALLAFVTWVNMLPFTNEIAIPINDVLPLDVHQQIVVWLLGVALVTRGLMGHTPKAGRRFVELLRRPDEFAATNKGLKPLVLLRAARGWLLQRARRLQQAPTVAKLEFLAVSAILLLALALRTYNLELIHRFVDEVHWFDAVPRVWDFSTNIRIFMPFSSVTAFTWLYPYFEASFVGVLGPSFTAIRLLSAFVGTLGIAAVYYFGRVLFDRPIALLAALLLATFPPHIQFSRIALNNIADPLFGTLALAFLAHGVKSSKRGYFVLSGVALGLTQYFYEGGRLLYPPLLGVFAFYLLLQPTPKEEGESSVEVQLRGWRLVGHLGLLAITTLIISLPVYITLGAQHLSLTTRLGEMGFDLQYWRDAISGASSVYWEHLLRNTLAYVQLPELGWFYGGNTALMLPFVVPLFFLGLWHALWRIRQPGMLMLIVWIVAATVGTSLTRDLWSARYVVVFPTLMLLVALGIRLTLPLLAPLLGIARNLLREDDSQPDPRPVYSRRYGRALAGLAVIFTGVLGVLEVNYYFNEHIDVYLHQGRFGGDVQDALFRAVNLPDGTYVHIITDQNLFRFDVEAIVRFWNRQGDLIVDVQPRGTLTLEYFRDQPLGFPHAFFIDTGDEVVFSLLRTYFIPDAPRVSPYGVPTEYQMMLYFVPAGSRVRQ
ncbi:MAG: glycosyltransferase family 39 protein [Anaerolineae bacterium]